MDKPRCPGPSRRDWTFEDVFVAQCPDCAAEIEFWKDDAYQQCRGCKSRVPNPRMVKEDP